MKNQSDLIVTIVAVLLMLIGVGVCFGTKREAVKPAPPETVGLSKPQLPAASVVMAAALPGASGSAGGGGGMMGGGRGMSMGGMMGGRGPGGPPGGIGGPPPGMGGGMGVSAGRGGPTSG